MGVVYKARHVTLKRVVALKMILGGRFASPGAMGRFQLEACAAAALNHPSIVPVYDFGEVEGQPYFTMAFVDGGSLHQLLAEGPLSPVSAARLLLHVAEAVQCAHDQGIIHRDIKPQNILLRREVVEGAPTDSATDRAAALLPMLTDFGLARATADGSGMTRTGEVMGTPSYMPPEQAEGDTEAVGCCSDIYSLGAVLYCTLTGRPPFHATDVRIVLRQLREEEPPTLRVLNPKVPRDLEAVCLKCLVKEPQGRYATVAQMVDDLKCFLADQPLRHARRVTSMDRAWRRLQRTVRRHPLGTTVAALLLAAAVGLSVWAVAAARERAQAFEAHIRSAQEAGADAEQTWKAGNRYEAQDKFTDAEGKYADLVQQRPDRSELRIALARLEMRKSELLSQMRQLDRAQSQLTDALAQLEKLPLLGTVNDARGGWKARNDALKDYEESRKIRQELSDRDRTNRKFRYDLARSYGYMGDTQLALGLTEKARSSYRESEEIRRALAEEPATADETPISAKYQYARSLGNTGAFYDWQDQPQEAIDAYLRRKKYLEALDDGATPAEFATDLPWCLVNIAQLQLDAGAESLDETKSLLNRARQKYQSLLDKNPTDRDSIVSLAQVDLNLGELALRAGDLPAAAEILERRVIDPLQALVLGRRFEQSGEYYLMAQALALRSQTKVGDLADQRKFALGYLKAAVDNGFCNLAQLKRDVAFRPFHQEAGYRDCVGRIQRERAESVQP
jgi:hypothetical protein